MGSNNSQGDPTPVLESKPGLSTWKTNRPLYSLVQTAKANGLEPYTWLRQVLRDLPAARTVEEVEALLPWNLRIPDLSGLAAA